MRYIKIDAYENGYHETYELFRPPWDAPDGWAMVPDEMTTENYPYGEVEAEDIDGIMTVTKWTAGTIPEPPEPQPPEPPTEEEDINAMLIDHELRIMDLELGITEE